MPDLKVYSSPPLTGPLPPKATSLIRPDFMLHIDNKILLNCPQERPALLYNCLTEGMVLLEGDYCIHELAVRPLDQSNYTSFV